MTPSLPAKLGLRFSETMRGHISNQPAAEFAAAEAHGRAANSPMEITVTIATDDLDALLTNPNHRARVSGTVIALTLASGPLTVTRGEFNLLTTDAEQVSAKRMRYALALRALDGTSFFLEGIKHVEGPSPLRLWPETTTLFATFYRGPDATGTVLARGIARISPADFARELSGIEVTNAPSREERLRALVRFGTWFAGSLFEIYGGVFARPATLDPEARPRERRPLRNPATGQPLIPEVHYFQTSDGLTLRLTRYACGDKGPLLLVHGLGVSSLIFTIDTIEVNLVEFFAQYGYDLWLLDYRASIELPYAAGPSNADLVASIDYPEAIEEVCRRTGRDSLQCLVHCYGASTFFMAMLRDGALDTAMRRVRSVAVSQIAAHNRVGLLIHAMSGLHVPEILERVLGVPSLTAQTSKEWVDRVIDQLLKLYPADADTPAHRLLLLSQDKNPVSRRISFLYGPLYELTTLNHDTYWDGLGRMFGVAGIKSFEHLTTIIRAGHVVSASGADVYLHNVRQLAIPITIVHGAGNRCWLPESTALTLEWLRQNNDPALYDRVVVPGYGHIDCIFGKNAATDVYPYWLAHLDKTAVV